MNLSSVTYQIKCFFFFFCFSLPFLVLWEARCKLAISVGLSIWWGMDTLNLQFQWKHWWSILGYGFFWGVPVIFSLEIGPWFNRWGRSKPSCASCHLMELAARGLNGCGFKWPSSGDLRSNSGNLTNTGGAVLATKKVHHYYFFLSRRLERSNWS